MNTSIPSTSTPQAAASTPEHLSALCDGCIDHSDLDALMDDCREDAEALERWHAYQVIGAVLRGNEPAVSVQGAAHFVEGIRFRLQQETPAPVAAPVRSMPAALVATGAANDGVFRWKLVAGFASLAAVAAVGWNLLVTVPTSPVSGAQLAQVPAAPPATGAAVGAMDGQQQRGQTVAVDTRQGTLIRDAGLERLLAEHRQNGGMSALQNPTGFIRNATYDADAR